MLKTIPSSVKAIKALLPLLWGAKLNMRFSDRTENQTGSTGTHRNWVHSTIYDNGLEFAKHQKMAQTFSANIYFAYPCASWEQGLNENINGFIRQYLPKSRRLDNVTQKEQNTSCVNSIIDPRDRLDLKRPMSYSSMRKLH